MSTPTTAEPASWLSSVTARSLAWVLGLLVALPTLAVGFFADDQGFIAALRSPHAPPFWDLFRFSSGRPEAVRALVESGHLPWWTSPEFKLHLLRPLAGALFALDARFFHEAWGYHLHSLAWYAVWLVALGYLYRRALPGSSSTIAWVVFAFSDAHLEAYGWPSARHVLIGAVPSALGLIAMLKASEGWRPGRWLTPLAFAIGLAGSEVALGGLAFWTMFQLFGIAPVDGRSRTWSERITGAMLPSGMGCVYLGIYRAFDFGARGGSAYHDPISEPLPFFRAAVLRIPTLLGDSLVGVPAEVSVRTDGTVLAWIGIGAVAFFGLLLWLCWGALSEVERRALRWLVPGALATTLMGASGFPSGRVMFLPDVGFAALIGVLLRAGFVKLAEGTKHAAPRGVRIAGALVLLLVHVVIAPLHTVITSLHLRRLARESERAARTAELGDANGEQIFLVASDPLIFMYLRGILSEEKPGSIGCWAVLSAASSSHRLTRTGTQTLSLESLERPLLEGAFETIFRATNRPLAVGDQVQQCGATLQVAEVHDGKPVRIDVDFHGSLDAPKVSLMAWQQGRLRRIKLPPVGGSTDLTWEHGPSRSF